MNNTPAIPTPAEVYGPVPEIIGWTWDRQAVNWRDATGEIRYDENLAETPTVDDMLAWLDEQGYIINIDYMADEASVYLETWDEQNQCRLPGPVAKKYPTLLDALEAVVRHVAASRAGD